jgi:hypothetical protein
MATTKQFVSKAALLLAISVFGVGAAAGQPTSPQATSTPTARDIILDSSRWREMQKEFHEWLSLQVVYTPQQVAEIKARLNAEIDKMSAAELQQFLDQWEAKIKILLGKDAAEAREWLGQFLSVAADGYRKQVFERLGITNVASMSASQIEDAIHNIRAKEMHLRQERSVFDQGRSLQAQSASQFQADQRAAMERAGQSQAPKFGSYQTPMAPKQFDWRPRAPLIPWGGWW